MLQAGYFRRTEGRTTQRALSAFCGTSPGSIVGSEQSVHPGVVAVPVGLPAFCGASPSFCAPGAAEEEEVCERTGLADDEPGDGAALTLEGVPMEPLPQALTAARRQTRTRRADEHAPGVQSPPGVSIDGVDCAQKFAWPRGQRPYAATCASIPAICNWSRRSARPRESSIAPRTRCS